MSALDRLPSGLRKLMLYAVCGGSGFALDFLVFTLLVMGGTWYLLANIIAYALGTCLSFVLNRTITFGVRDAPVRRFLSFLSVAALGYVVSTAALWVMVEVLRVDLVLAKILTLFVVLAVQFTLNSLITFRSASTEPTSKRA